MRVSCIRDVGPQSGVGPCFERLFKWAQIVGAPTGRLLTLSFHRPNTAPAQRWYWKVGVEMFTHERPPPGIEIETVGAGRHAVYRLVGSYEAIADAYGRLFDEWLPDSGEAVADRPCMELYRNTPQDTVPAHLATDLCVPLQEPQPGSGSNA